MNPARLTSSASLLVVFAAGSVSAQKNPSPVCDTAAVRASAVRAVRTVELVATPALVENRLPRPFTDELVERIAAEFKMPGRIATGLYAGPGRLPTDTAAIGDTTWARPDIYVLARVVVNSSGRRRSIGGRLPGGDVELNEVFFGAVARALEDSSWATPTGGTHFIDVEVNVRATATTKEIADRTKAEREQRLVIREVGRISLPHYPNAQPPRVVKAGTLRYPESMRVRNEAGTAKVAMVQDTSGAIVPGSLWYSEATSAEFLSAVRNFLRGTRYGPMRIAGCPVTARAIQPFTFSLR
jgi:hypothetical protein